MTDDELEAIDPAHTPAGDEFTLLTGFLDYYRGVIERKAQGLTREQLAVRLGPSDLTLGGLIKHLAWAEDLWFQVRLRGAEPGEPWAGVDWQADPDWEIHSAVDDEPAQLLDLYRSSCERSRTAIAEVGDLDAMSVKPNRRGEHVSLRFILVHMLEETARHAGHADLIRESVDGSKGD